MNIKKILILAIFLVAIVGIIAPVSAAIESANKDKVYSIESKEKSVNNKVTWDANGGTVGAKKTISANVKKGSKIGKLPATPKRSGHTFSGWYTKKTGGSKISKDTKPSKAVTYYAQWKKATPAKNDAKSKLVGKWRYTYPSGSFVEYIFKSDGTYISEYYSKIDGEEYINQYKGKYYQSSLSNSRIYVDRDVYTRDSYDGGKSWNSWKSDSGGWIEILSNNKIITNRQVTLTKVS